MAERKYNFDRRIPVFQAPEGKVNVRFYGLPVAVTRALPGEEYVGKSGLTSSQFDEIIGLMMKAGIFNFQDLKERVATSRDIIPELMHMNPHLVEMSFTSSQELRASGGTLAKGYEHLQDCDHCHNVLRSQIKDY